MSKRSIFIVVLLLLVVAGFIYFVSPPFNKQGLGRPKRIAMLMASDLQLASVDGIKAGLKELGREEEKDIVIEVLNPRGDLELTKKMAADIVASKPDLIVSLSTSASSAMKDADKNAKIPLIAVDVGNFAQLGVENIQHPGGFMTGVVVDNVAAAPKRMEILKTLLPKLKTVGILANPKNVSYKNVMEVHEGAAGKLGLKVLWYDVTKKEEVPRAMQKLVRDNVEAFMTVNDAAISSNSDFIAPVLKGAKIPSIDFNVERGVSSGYLMVYGVPRFEGGKQGAGIVDKILKGANPGDIPVEFASALRFEINAALAKSFGLTVPEKLLLEATKVYNK